MYILHFIPVAMKKRVALTSGSKEHVSYPWCCQEQQTTNPHSINVSFIRVLPFTISSIETARREHTRLDEQNLT